MLEFRVLGPFEVTDDDIPIQLGGPKQRAVLAVLVLRANHTVSGDQLMEAVWGGDAAQRGPQHLQTYVSNLRRALEPATGTRTLLTRPPGYVLQVEHGQVDLDQFKGLGAEGRRLVAEGRLDEAVAVLLEAEGLWRGRVLEDLEFEPIGVAISRDRIEEERRGLVEDRIDAELALGRHAAMCPELEQSVADEPFRERRWGQLMLALYRSGRQAAALAAFRRAREALREELGLDPGPELQDLEKRILAQDPTLDASAAGARRVSGPQSVAASVTAIAMGYIDDSAGRSSLPAPDSPLVGRKTELDELSALLTDPDVRLVTLTGVGGTGKTRLALEAARRVRGQFHDGVVFVALAPVNEPRLVLPRLAEVLRLPEVADEDVVEALAAHLDDRQVLLVLDNLEQVVEVAPELGSLLATSGTTTILATSRGPLRIAAEHCYPVGPLPRDAAEDLFVARARASRPGLKLSPADQTAVAELCRRLDGLPLAIEIVATRARILNPTALLDRLSGALDVVASARDAPERHRTLRATLDWSRALLDKAERVLFARLGVFHGGADLAAVEEVCGDDDVPDPLEGLTGLIDGSLVLVTDAAAGGPRFGMLETVRAYAAERLQLSDEADTVCSRHAHYYVALADGAHHLLYTADETAATDRLVAEEENLRAALNWAFEHDPSMAARLAVDGSFWIYGRRLSEPREWLDKALALPKSDLTPELWAMVYTEAGTITWLQGDLDRGRRLLEEGLALHRTFEDVGAIAACLHRLGQIAREVGDLATATRYADELMDIAEQHSGNDLLARAWHLRGSVAESNGNFPEAAAAHERGLVVAREIGDPAALSPALLNLGAVRSVLGEHDTAQRHLAEALSHVRTANDTMILSLVLIVTARAGVAAGNSDLAYDLLPEALELVSERGDPDGFGQGALVCAALAALRSEPHLSARLLGVASGASIPMDVADGAQERAFIEPFRSAVRTDLGEAAFAEAFQDGEQLEQSAALALTLGSLRRPAVEG